MTEYVLIIGEFLFLQGPCHIELHGALDMIASSQQELGDKFTTFYLPNCDKHGFYKAKQVGIDRVFRPIEFRKQYPS